MREKRWDLDLPFGQLGEEMVKAILLSQNVTVEVKRDELASDKGNVAIEFECSGEPSGIWATEAEWWAHILSGDKYKDEVVIFIRTERLKKLVKRNHTRIVFGGNGRRAKMALVPIADLLKG